MGAGNGVVSIVIGLSCLLAELGMIHHPDRQLIQATHSNSYRDPQYCWNCCIEEAMLGQGVKYLHKT